MSNKFNENEEMTINSIYFEKELEYNNEKYVFCLWVKKIVLYMYAAYIQDTAGQEKFNALTPIYYRDAKGAILVYDVSISETFKKVQKWVEELKAFNKNTLLAIAGNKCDLKIFDVDKNEVLEYANKVNAKHFYTSAKTGEGLEEIFEYITREIAAAQKGGMSTGKGQGRSKKLLLEKSQSKIQNEGGKCCK